MGFKSKAELNFEEKVRYHTEHHEWKELGEVFEQYGQHLKLLEPMCSYEDQWSDEVGAVSVCVHHGQNSRFAVTDGEHRPCLASSPWPVELEEQVAAFADQLTSPYAGLAPERITEEVDPWLR